MNAILIVFLSLTVSQTVKGQLVQYAARMRNFSIESETNGAYMIDMRIYQDKNEHKVAATLNITKDIQMKSIEVIVYRCSFEKFFCENFQKWKFIRSLKSIVYMKNQIWTPLFDPITPKLDIPSVKKNIYKIDGNIDSKAIITWYPEAVNYLWRADISWNDYDDKKPFIMKIEVAIFTFVKRNRKNDRGGTRLSNTAKIGTGMTI